MKKLVHLLLQSALCTATLISINGCEGWWFEKAAFGEVAIEGEPLKLLVVQKPLTYQRLAQLENGFEFEVLQQFALDTGYHLQVQTVRNERALAKELAAGHGDIGAARFSDLTTFISAFQRSPVYDEEKTALVCRRDTELQFTPAGHIHSESRWKLVINPNSIEAHWIPQIRKEVPHLKIVSKATMTPVPLLRELSQGKGDCTLMDHLEAQYYLRVFPALRLVKDISNNHSFFFLISQSRPELGQKLRRWMMKAAHHQFLSQAKVRARGDHHELSPLDIRNFLQARNTVFPRYAALFRKHSQNFGIPWQLAAAVAYQESKWDPEAQSFTGVRGFMQLTEETAEHLGVEDRLDTDQSIWGGTKYIRMLLDRQPKGLAFREKLALALATYNIGPAHMIDAQKLAHKLGKNPYAWKDLREVLPLLAEKNYISELKYGPARGQEPVDYVHRVFAYLDLISVQI